MDTSYANPVAALDETRAELRAVAQKLSSCERALEGHGVYLGIKEPATLLDQLKTLQKKDEQLREVLLIFLRAIPLRAPSLPIATTSPVPRPPASPAATAPPSSSTLAVSGQSHQQQPQPHIPPAQPRVRHQSADHVAETGAAYAARGAARSSAPPTSGAARSVSLHEALGIPPPKNGEASAAEAPGSSAASSQGSTYRPGQHALYRTTGAAATDGGAARGEKELASTSGRGARLAAVRVGSGARAGEGAGAGAPMRYNIRVVGPAGGPSATPRASPSRPGMGTYDRNAGVVSCDGPAGVGAAERARAPPSAASPSHPSSSTSSSTSSSSSSSSSTAQPSPAATPVSAPSCAGVRAPSQPSPRATAATDGGHRPAEGDNDDDYVDLGDGSVVINDKSHGNARPVARRAASPGADAPPSSERDVEVGAAVENEESDGRESRAGGGGDGAATEVAERGDAPSPADRAVRGNHGAVRGEGPTPPERARTRASRNARRAACAEVGSAAQAASGDGAAGSSEKGAGAAPEGGALMTIKNELMEDMREEVSGEVLTSISERTDGLLAAGLVDAALRAAARATAKVAVRPLSAAERERPVLLHDRVKMEVADAVAEAVSHVARDTTPGSVMPSLVTTRVMGRAGSAFMRNFDVPQDGEFVTCKVADKARRSPPPPTSRTGSGPRGPARSAETVAVDHEDPDGEDEAAGSRGALATQVDTPGTAADEDEATPAAAEVAAEAAAVERRVESERVRGAGRQGLAAGREQPSASQPRAAVGLSAGPAVSQMPAVPSAPAPRGLDVVPGSREGRGGGGGRSAAVPPNVSDSGSGSGSSSRSGENSSSSSTTNNNNNNNNNGRPARKRRKSAEAGGWRGRYSKDEFYLGEASSDGGEDWTAQGPEVCRSGKVELTSGTTGDGITGVAVGGDGGEESEGQLVDVGAEEDDEDYYDDDLDDANDDYPSAGTTAGDGGSGARKRKAATPLGAKKKRSPPNAWKKRCADGNCQLGASFGMLGKPAMYCSAHRDAGMVNVTHRRCEEPGCIHQPSFNIFGLKKALFCAKHKRQGMVNVSSPRCESPGCMVRPSFGFESDRRASLCDTHKRTGMTNIRKKSRRKSNGVLGAGHGVVVEAAAAAATGSGADLLRFDSPFLSDSPSLAAAMAAATTSTPTLPPPPFGDDDADAHAAGRLMDGAGVGTDAGIGSFGGGGSGAGRPGSFLDGAVDIGS